MEVIEMCIESMFGKLCIPIDTKDDWSLDDILNRAGCPICGDKLYWEAKVHHDSESSTDSIRLVSSCCGKTFICQIIDGEIVLEDYE